MHHNTIFSLPVFIAVVLFACRHVSCTSPVKYEVQSIPKSIGAGSSASSASSAAASASGARAGSSASSAAAGSSGSGAAGSSASSAAAGSSGPGGFSFTGPEVRPLPLPGRPNPIPNPVPNHFPLPPCTPNPEYIVVPQYIPPSASIFTNVPVVTLFTNAFLDYGYSNAITRELFDLSKVPVYQYADYVRRSFENVLIDLGVDGASSKVQFLYQALMRNFGCSGCPRLSLAIKIRKAANFIVNILYVENLLTLDNAESLGLAFAKTMADSASLTMTSDPTSKFPALFNGYYNFLQSVGLITKEKIEIVLFYDGNEWYKAGSDYRWW